MAGFNVKPDLLQWAIERSGLPEEFLFEKFPKLEAWISLEKQPTLKQLQSFAKKTMVPFGYLFLNSPPQEKLPVPDYRTRDGGKVKRPSPNLIDTLYDMQRRQEWMREYLLERGHESLSFVGTVNVGDDITESANRIRKELGLAKGWAQRTGSTDSALRLLRDKIEEAGILIFLSGIVANNTTRTLDVEEFQGFVLSDDIVPLIFVNSTDAKNAQMFTIAHELVHVWVGKSALFDNLMSSEFDNDLEKFCNSVAAELLVPELQLLEVLRRNKPVSSVDFKSLSRVYRVSPVVIARRCLDAKQIDEGRFFAFYIAYMEELKNVPKRGTDGGNFWNNQNTRLGERFGRAVITSAKEGRLSYSDAYGLVNLKGKTFDKYADRLFGKGGE